MPNSAEIIEILARKLERQRFLSELKMCSTPEDYKKLQEKYEILCQEDAQKES